VLHGDVDPTRGKKEADSSKMICRFNTHLVFGAEYGSCTAAKTGK
jgi:predicted secreted protein